MERGVRGNGEKEMETWWGDREVKVALTEKGSTGSDQGRKGVRSRARGIRG